MPAFSRFHILMVDSENVGSSAEKEKEKDKERDLEDKTKKKKNKKGWFR